MKVLTDEEVKAIWADINNHSHGEIYSMGGSGNRQYCLICRKEWTIPTWKCIKCIYVLPDEEEND